MDNQLFSFDVKVEMTEEGLKPHVNLYDSAVDIGINEGRALEQAVCDYVKDWLRV